MSTSETAPSPEDGEDVAPLTEPLLSPSVDGEDEESGLSVAPTSSLPAALSNVVMAVLGAGQLTLPYVMSQLGFAFGMLLLVCFALVVVYSSALLRALTASTKAATYGDMLGRALGPRWKTACAVVVVLYAFGTAVSYFLIIREQLHRIAAFFLPTSDTGATPWEENKVFMLVVVTALVVYPLSALRDLTALRFSSSLGSLFALYITSVVCLYAPWGADRYHIREDDGGVVLLRVCRGGHPPSPDLAPRLWPRSFAAFAAASPLLAFALNSGWAFVPVFASLRDPTPSRGATLILVSHAIIAVNYLIIAGVGYARITATRWKTRGGLAAGVLGPALAAEQRWCSSCAAGSLALSRHRGRDPSPSRVGEATTARPAAGMTAKATNDKSTTNRLVAVRRSARRVGWRRRRFSFPSRWRARAWRRNYTSWWD